MSGKRGRGVGYHRVESSVREFGCDSEVGRDSEVRAEAFLSIRWGELV